MVKLDFPSPLFLAKQCLLKAFLAFISMIKGGHCLVPSLPHNIIKMTFKPHDKSILSPLNLQWSFLFACPLFHPRGNSLFQCIFC